jgi:hypothetical protein
MSTQNSVSFYPSPVNGVEVTRCYATIYALGTGTPVQLYSQQVNSTSFAVSLNLNPENYYTVQIDAYDYLFIGNESTYSLDSRKVSYYAVFKGSDTYVAISGQTTVACACCFARFSSLKDQRLVQISGDNRRLGLAYGMKNNFVAANGVVSKVISKSPNGLETNSYGLMNFLSNILYYCMIEAGVYNGFLQYAAPAGTPATNTLQGRLSKLKYFLVHIFSTFLLLVT